MGADRILSQLLGGGAASGFAGGLAGGLASGLLTSKAGRKFGKSALKVGGIAAVGGLAYAAFSRYRQQQQASGGAGHLAAVEPSALSERFVPTANAPRQVEQLGLTLLRAMIAAAQADGRLDGRERHTIEGRVRCLDLPDADKAELLAQLDRPVDMSTLVAEARTPEIAAEIYTASLLAIDVDTPAERAYLAMLAARLGLPEELVGSIHRELEISEADAQPPSAVQGLAS
ncbi:MAG: tellurite resistance TerB family protein [Proteobacteria bacterium]|nr:tellurite resistance TerB family protein [Pseudomonadota bacterium]